MAVYFAYNKLIDRNIMLSKCILFHPHNLDEAEFFIKDFDKDHDINIGWQIITPPTRDEDDDDKLVFSKALNQPSRELRDEELKEIFNLDLFA